MSQHHAFHIGDDSDGDQSHADYNSIANISMPILANDTRSSSSSISSNNVQQSTDGVFAIANPQPEGQTQTSSSSSFSSSSSTSSSSSSANECPTAVTANGDGNGSVVLNLKTLTGQVMSIRLPSFDGLSVLQLKQAFESAHGIPAQLQRWIWAGRELNDSSSAAECRLEDGATVHLLLRQNPAGPVGAPVAVPVPVGGVAPPAYGVGVPGGYVDDYGGADPRVLEGGAVINGERMGDIRRAFQLARALRIFAIIDAIILLIWSLSFPPFAVGVVLCLIGYYGATNVRLPYVAVFLVYLVLTIALRIYLVAAVSDLLSRILFLILATISMYVLRLTIQFIKYLKSFTDQERAELAWMIRPYTRPMPGYV